MSGSSKFARFDRLRYCDIIKLEEVVCKLCNEHQCDDVDELRCKMFCKGKSHQLPPTRASLENHLKRANYQVCSRPSVS